MELKFRIWDNQKQKFFEPIYDASNGNLQEILIGCSGDINVRRINQYGIIILEHESIYPNRFVKSMFTGLKDKNGVSIYEGDIVNFTLSHNSDNNFQKSQVEFFKYAWRLKRIWLLTEINTNEVIGNIYQNKNLIEP